MAPKKPSPLEVPPAVSSSEEEEEVSSGEEVESQEGEEEEVESQEEDANTEQNHKLPTKKAASPEEDGSDSESESDSDHLPRGVADPNVKPVDDASKLKKPRSKPTASPSVVAVTPTRSASKRRVENRGGDGKDSKRAKKKKVTEAASGDAVETTEKENQPKKLFKRVWSEEDEIIILKGMKDFSLKKGTDPITDFDGFSEFIKNSLHIDFTRTQLNDKMRKLKKKYLTNADKKYLTFSKPHYQNVFNLSKEMWGTEANIVVGADAPPKKDREEQKKSGPSQAAALEEYVLLNQTINTSGLLDAKLIKEGLSLIDSNKKSELEEEWRELQMAEAEMFLRRIEFARKQTQIALDALKKH